MISKNEFDCFIKKNLVDVFGNDCFGYEIEDKSYDVYYNKEAYNKFISKMQNGKYNKFYNQYNRGKGSELKEKRNMPPKMASVASSSRFCYLALRDGYKQFNKMDLIEQWETGIQRIINRAKEYELPKPEFREIGNTFRVNLYRKADKKPIKEPIKTDKKPIKADGKSIITSKQRKNLIEKT